MSHQTVSTATGRDGIDYVTNRQSEGEGNSTLFRYINAPGNYGNRPARFKSFQFPFGANHRSEAQVSVLKIDMATGLHYWHAGRRRTQGIDSYVFTGSGSAEGSVAVASNGVVAMAGTDYEWTWPPPNSAGAAPAAGLVSSLKLLYQNAEGLIESQIQQVDPDHTLTGVDWNTGAGGRGCDISPSGNVVYLLKAESSSVTWLETYDGATGALIDRAQTTRYGHSVYALDDDIAIVPAGLSGFGGISASHIQQYDSACALTAEVANTNKTLQYSESLGLYVRGNSVITAGPTVTAFPTTQTSTAMSPNGTYHARPGGVAQVMQVVTPAGVVVTGTVNPASNGSVCVADDGTVYRTGTGSDYFLSRISADLDSRVWDVDLGTPGGVNYLNIDGTTGYIIIDCTDSGGVGRRLRAYDTDGNMVWDQVSPFNASQNVAVHRDGCMYLARRSEYAPLVDV